MATATEQVTSTQDLAGADSREGDGPAKIELTYSTLQAINRARLAFDMAALRIIQVLFSDKLPESGFRTLTQTVFEQVSRWPYSAKRSLD